MDKAGLLARKPSRSFQKDKFVWWCKKWKQTFLDQGNLIHRQSLFGENSPVYRCLKELQLVHLWTSSIVVLCCVVDGCFLHRVLVRKICHRDCSYWFTAEFIPGWLQKLFTGSVHSLSFWKLLWVKINMSFSNSSALLAFSRKSLISWSFSLSLFFLFTKSVNFTENCIKTNNIQDTVTACTGDWLGVCMFSLGLHL